MPDAVRLAKAQLRQLDADFANEIEESRWVTVQFNPETLKVSFANQIATPSTSGDQSGPASQQFVGAGSTKLSVQIWFDVTVRSPDEQPPASDVRALTGRVAYFITPVKQRDGMVPPAVRFLWGSFQFDGIMESLDESLELFSADGIPLRANMSFSLSQQKIAEVRLAETDRALGGAVGPLPGQRPLVPAPAGATLQKLADASGRGGQWQGIAMANGIENPRLLQPGQLIDLNAPVPRPPRFG